MLCVKLAISWTEVCVVCVHQYECSVGVRGDVSEAALVGLVCRYGSRKNPNLELTEWVGFLADLCDLGFILSPLSIIFFTWNLGLFSQPPASLKDDMNWGGGRDKEREEAG